jgi:hypothetical protein
MTIDLTEKDFAGRAAESQKQDSDQDEMTKGRIFEDAAL